MNWDTLPISLSSVCNKCKLKFNIYLKLYSWKHKPKTKLRIWSLLTTLRKIASEVLMFVSTHVWDMTYRICQPWMCNTNKIILIKQMTYTGTIIIFIVHTCIKCYRFYESFMYILQWHFFLGDLWNLSGHLKTYTIATVMVCWGIVQLSITASPTVFCSTVLLASRACILFIKLALNQILINNVILPYL